MQTGTEPRAPAEAPSGRPASTITMRNVTKRFGRLTALNGLSLNIPASGIHALLGGNGAGKSTLLRVLVGLSRADEGSMTMLGEEVPARLATVMPRVGAVIGPPRFHPHVSVRRNLIILSTALGLGRRRALGCLHQMDLGRQQHQTFRTLDANARQRMGVAAALLKSPELLILDEPVPSPTDATDTFDLRAFLTELATKGTTVVVSSHQISDVLDWADSASIIDEGRLVTQQSVQGIVEERAHRVTIGVRDAARAARVLRDHDLAVRATGPSELVVTVAGTDPSDTARITALLARDGLYIHQMTSQSPSLEDTIITMNRPGAA